MLARMPRGLMAALLAVPLWFLPSAAWDQTSTWAGGTQYTNFANWNNFNVPDSPGESALFGLLGGTAITLGSTVNPDSWTFNSFSQAILAAPAASPCKTLRAS